MHDRISTRAVDQDIAVSVVVPCFNEEQALPVLLLPDRGSFSPSPP